MSGAGLGTYGHDHTRPAFCLVPCHQWQELVAHTRVAHLGAIFQCDRQCNATALVLGLVFFGLVFLIYGFIQMSHGDINRDGVIDGEDTSILQSHATLSEDGSTNFTQLSAPSASTSSPRRVIQKPIIFTN